MKSTTKVVGKVRSKSASETILLTRKKILRQIKQRVADHLEKEPRELSLYRQEYEKNFRQKFKPSNIEELLTELASAQIIFGGDFHAFSQAQRMHLKILRRLSEQEEVTIALEAANATQNQIIADFLGAKISEKSFLSKMRWNENWGFPWENYRPLFEFARLRKYRIIGLSKALDGKRSLRQRDQSAARLLHQEFKKHPHRKYYVIFGDLHLAAQHLPHEFARLAPAAKILSVLLNPEKIYFKLAEKGLENKVEIVKLNDEQFCIMGSPPWVQWQSYLMYLERSHDQMLEDEDPEFDPTDEVKSLVELICADLQIQIKLNDLSIYSSYNDQLWRAISRFLSAKDLKLVEELIEDGRSIYFPQNGTGYLARSSVNHLAELSGFYLHAKISKRKRFFWSMPKDFERQIWCDAMGFFLSKMINHKRYSQSLVDLSTKLGENIRASEQEILKLALDHRMTEMFLIHQSRKRKKEFKPRRKTSYLFAARILGSMMGERLYIALQSNKIKLEEIVQFLKFDPERADFLEFYLRIVKWLEPIHVEMKNRGERL